ncbi:glycosyltransferase [uncultured Pseudokineococcus sp.]|uniref:glycosyltransferase family 2 protein n=1 Tax=uncultured Pseudokineococcus sp. TaxID=1642928 RepID=UPI00260B2537|nr:glycosyltransferase [uncultured Pseudokineococcus sp.]
MPPASAAAPSADAAGAAPSPDGPTTSGAPGRTGGPRPSADPRLAVVVITHRRRAEVLRALERLRDLPERPAVAVVDNGSDDGTAEAVAAEHPWALLVASPENLGALGRDVGVAALERALDPPPELIAFCDDDTWWEPGSLARAADVLEAHPALACVTAQILVEPGGRQDAINVELRESPVEGPSWLPGPALGSFLAGASVVRRSAFREVGGFSRRLWLGGEEELMASDLAAAGWELCHLPELVLHHQPSPARERLRRRRDGVRNTLWFTWLRRPVPAAARRTAHLLASIPRDRTSAAGVALAIAGLPWVVRERRRLPAYAEARFAALEESQRRSTARHYG